MPLQAGVLDQRIDILQRQLAPDPEGGQALTWTTLYANVPAGVTPEQATEDFQSGRMIGITTYRIRIRYRSDVTNQHRVNWRGRKIDLRSVWNVSGANEELQLTGVEIEGEA